jgi:hypothetical protein
MTGQRFTQDVICPQCHVRNDVPMRLRSAGGFCSGCDYPLFHIPTAGADGARRPMSERSARRRPGVRGHTYDGSIPCPSCGEPNRSDAVVCHRDRTALLPEPAAVAPAVLPPPPLPFIVLTDEPSLVPAVPRPTAEEWAMLLLVLAVVPLLIALIVLIK